MASSAFLSFDIRRGQFRRRRFDFREYRRLSRISRVRFPATRTSLFALLVYETGDRRLKKHRRRVSTTSSSAAFGDAQHHRRRGRVDADFLSIGVVTRGGVYRFRGAETGSGDDRSLRAAAGARRMSSGRRW